MPVLKPTKNKTETGVQAVALALQIIETLAFSDRAQGVTELAKTLGTTKTRVYNYLRTLVDHGYAVQDADTDLYRVGVRVSQIGGAVANEFNLVSLSRAPMRRLVETLRHTVVLSKFDGSTLYTVDQAEGRSMLKISIRIGNVLDLHASAQGKVVLAFGPGTLLEQAIANGLPAVTRSTITDADKLRREIRLVRQRGWADAPDQTRLGVDALAVPIIDRTRRLVATLAILAPSDEMPSRPDRQALDMLSTAAQEISAGLSPRT